MSGSSRFAENLALIPGVLSSTHQGKLWYISSVALVALLVAALFAAQPTRPVAAWPFLVSLFLIACTKAASGHAANEGDFTLAELSMLLHILGVSVWAGAVLASGLLVLPSLGQSADPAAFWTYGRLLSRTVTWALLALLLSGVYTSDRELDGKLSGLWRSGWGRILMTKVAFVLLAVVLGASSRFKCLQYPATRQRASLMVRLVRTGSRRHDTRLAVPVRSACEHTSRNDRSKQGAGSGDERAAGLSAAVAWGGVDLFPGDSLAHLLRIGIVRVGVWNIAELFPRLEKAALLHQGAPDEIPRGLLRVELFDGAKRR